MYILRKLPLSLYLLTCLLLLLTACTPSTVEKNPMPNSSGIPTTSTSTPSPSVPSPDADTSVDTYHGFPLHMFSLDSQAMYWLVEEVTLHAPTPKGMLEATLLLTGGELLELEIIDHVAYVSLSESFAPVGTSDFDIGYNLARIGYNLCLNKDFEIYSVQFLINGDYTSMIAPYTTDTPWTPGHEMAFLYNQPLYDDLTTNKIDYYSPCQDNSDSIIPTTDTIRQSLERTITSSTNNIPKHTKILDFRIEGTTAYIDFDKTFMSPSLSDIVLTTNASVVLHALIGYPDSAIEYVQFTIAGSPINHIGLMDTSKPVSYDWYYDASLGN